MLKCITTIRIWELPQHSAVYSYLICHRVCIKSPFLVRFQMMQYPGASFGGSCHPSCHSSCTLSCFVCSPLAEPFVATVVLLGMHKYSSLRNGSCFAINVSSGRQKFSNLHASCLRPSEKLEGERLGTHFNPMPTSSTANCSSDGTMPSSEPSLIGQQLSHNDILAAETLAGVTTTRQGDRI
jgi:hypothetical protein